MLQLRYVILAMELVMREFPYYNRSGGRDHASIWSWDYGSCEVAGHPVMQPTIKLSHFGLIERPTEDQMMRCICRHCGPGGDLIIPDMMERVHKAKTNMR